MIVFRLALNCVGLEGEGLGAAYRIAAEYGIEWLEVFHERNYTEADGEQVVADIASRGLRVSAVDALSQLYLEPSRAERNQEILRYQIELAAAAGAPYAITYFGFGGERDDQRAMKVYAERLAPCLERAEELNVTILLENEFDSAALDPAGSDITRRPEVVRELIEKVGSARFRTNFDPSNYNFAGVEPFPYAYEILEDVIEYVHVKDGHRIGGSARRTMQSSGCDRATTTGSTRGARSARAPSTGTSSCAARAARLRRLHPA